MCVFLPTSFLILLQSICKVSLKKKHRMKPKGPDPHPTLLFTSHENLGYPLNFSLSLSFFNCKMGSHYFPANITDMEGLLIIS